MLGSGEHYALEVAGDSMIEAGILDGDTVIIRRAARRPRPAQIVVALVDDTEVTLKRLRRRGNSIALEPRNVRHETRIFPADRVQGAGPAGRAAAALLTPGQSANRNRTGTSATAETGAPPRVAGTKRHRSTVVCGRYRGLDNRCSAPRGPRQASPRRKR